MWEGACSRRRCINQLMCRLIHRLREQAPSHSCFQIGFCGDHREKCHYSDVRIHTMTIRRLLVLSGLLGGLFFYSQLKDIDSITGSKQPSREG
ncbi:hypothetical protein C3E98_022780 [Pseudomonas sp. MWU13-2625]|nr:hypothetical protein C3E97_026300 [Pseudomonas sp. MWU12-2115]RBL69264.1 hypothetical protein C3E98_022780 [Pseudomonas sp. MWU13-2625]